MIGLDTNVLLRLFVADDPAQAKKSKALVASIAAAGDQARIDRVVLVEFATVLARRFKVPRTGIAAALEALLSASEFSLEDEGSVEAALIAYRRGHDFADALIGQVNRRAGCTVTYTFDADAAGMPAFALLH